MMYLSAIGWLPRESNGSAESIQQDICPHRNDVRISVAAAMGADEIQGPILKQKSLLAKRL